MALWLLFPKIGKSAIDQWCQHQLVGFSMEPVAPLSATQLSAAAGSVKLFSAIGLRAVSVPLAIGTATAAVSTIVAVELHEPAAAPSEQLPQTTIVQQDTLTTSVDTIPAEVVVPVQTQPKVARRQGASSIGESMQYDSSSAISEPAAPPVVVKKVIRKKKMTVVVKDTNN